MAGWFGPSGDCGCCGNACPCLNYPSLFGRSFSGAPTVKIVIADVADEITTERFDFAFASGGVNYYHHLVRKITGMSAVNGTYFFEIPKTVDNCIDEVTTLNLFSNVTGLPYTRTRHTVQGDTGCTVIATTVLESTTASAGPGVKSQWDYFDGLPYPHLWIYFGVSSITDMAIYTNDVLQCPTWDVDDVRFINSIYLKQQTKKIWAEGISGGSGRCGVSSSSWLHEIGNFTVTLENI